MTKKWVGFPSHFTCYERKAGVIFVFLESEHFSRISATKLIYDIQLEYSVLPLIRQSRNGGSEVYKKFGRC